jgi:peptidoglycan/LPS O-acetylase OafA/YrhL
VASQQQASLTGKFEVPNTDGLLNLSNRREISLDSLRGLAALAVVFYHCKQLYSGEAYGRKIGLIDFSPLRLIFAGHGAVMVFFALSGFVLSESFRRAKPFKYLPYVVKRFARIYPPFVFAIGISSLLFFLCEAFPVPNVTDEFGSNIDWSKGLSILVLLRHLLMTGNPNDQWLDPPMWSLVYELRISFIFPLLALATLRAWKLSVFLSLSASLLSLALLRSHVNEIVHQVAATLQYLFLFVGGAALSMHSTELKRWVKTLKKPARLTFWVLSLIIITFPAKTIAGLLCGIAALAIVALAFADPSAKEILSHKMSAWLGRISYSLYLIHVPVLYAMFHLLYGRIPVAFICLSVVVVSLFAAQIMERFVERTSMKAGKRFANAISALS